MSYLFFGGGWQRPSYQAHYQPIGAIQTSGPGSSDYGQESELPFSEQSNIFHVNNEAQSSWTAQTPSHPSILPQNHVQMIQEELALARQKNREYEATIIHQANFMSQIFPIGFHALHVPHAFAPLMHPFALGSNSYFQHRFSSMLGLQSEATGISPLNYSMHPPGFDRHPLTTPLSGIASLPLPSWFGTHLMSGLNPAITAQTTYRPPSLESDLGKRPRDSADRESEIPSKKARHSPMPTSTSSQHNPVVAIHSLSRPDSHFSQFTSTDASTTSDSDNWSVEYNPEVERTLEVKLVRTISEKPIPYRIKFSPDCQRFAVMGSNGIVSIYNTATWTKICLLKDLSVKEGTGSLFDLSFSSNGKYLATCTGWPENIARVWDVGKRHARNVFKGHFGGILALDFSPDGRFLISGSFDGTVRIWNMRDGSSRIFNHSNHDVFSVRFSPDGRRLAAGNEGGEVLIWELRSGHLVALLNGMHTDYVDNVDFMPNGEGLIIGSWDKTLKYRDITGLSSAWMPDEKGHDEEADGAEKKGNFTFVGHTDKILSVSVSPDGHWIVSGSADHTVRIWNTRTGTQQCILQAHKGSVSSVSFRPAGGFFASADYEGAVRIWSYTEGV